MKKHVVIFLLIFVAIAMPIFAENTSPWNKNGLTIEPPNGKKYDSPSICSDSKYGIIAAFCYENRILIRKADVNMNKASSQWPESGIVIESGSPNIFFSDPNICSDLLGGTYVAFTDIPGYDIHIYKIGPNGEVNPYPWPSCGLTIESGTTDLPAPKITSDGMGGLFLAYTEKSVVDNIRVLKINAKAEICPSPWPKNGLLFSREFRGLYMADICSYVNGGAVLACVDKEESNIQLFKITSSGTKDESWLGGTLELASDGMSLYFPSICQINNGNILVAYTDKTGSIYVTKVGQYGDINPDWPGRGIAILAEKTRYSWPKICRSGTNEAVLAYLESVNFDLELAKILPNGTIASYPGGTIKADSGSDSFFAPVLAENSGRNPGEGVFVSYYDKSRGNIHIDRYLMTPIALEAKQVPVPKEHIIPSNKEAPSLGKNAYQLKFGEGTTFIYALSEDMDLRISIFEFSGLSVWHKNIRAGSGGGRAGKNSVSWDGNDDLGSPVISGYYMFIISSGDSILMQGRLLISQ
jgi:hypothetical protein